MSAVDPVRVARAYLVRVAEPPALALTAFVAEAGGPEEAADRVRAQRVPPAVAAETQARHAEDRTTHDLAAAAGVGARLVIPEDDEWPAWPFAAFWPAACRGVSWAAPPLALWVRGPARLADVTDAAVAVVGARAATAYGTHVAGQLAHDLAAHDVTVVSGAAYGIDAAAHRGALAGGGSTIAVLACGIDIDYPAAHDTLLRRIATAAGGTAGGGAASVGTAGGGTAGGGIGGISGIGGSAGSAAAGSSPSYRTAGRAAEAADDSWGSPSAVVSEYAPGTPPARHRFLIRNRLIAAMAEGTVVVEAGIRSGARNTASAATELGKVLMAVPGPVTSAVSRGCHDLIRSGAAVAVDGAREVVESIGRATPAAPTADGATRRVTDGLDPVVLRVHEALRPRAGRTPDQLARDSGVPITAVRAALPALEQGGLAVRDDTGWRLARAPGFRLSP